MGLSAHDWDIVLQAPLFKAMGPTISRAIIQDRAPRRYARGEQIFQEGDPAEGFFVVIEGWAKLLRLREDGEEVVVAIFSAGETFAEVAMFLGGRYPASCEAVSPARILKVDAAVLRRAILAQPQLAFDMLAAASLRLRELVDEIERLKAQSAPQRIADFFLKQAAADSGRAEIALPYEKALIANRLGMKPESFSRALGKLEAFGVTVNRESVCISDLAKLAAFVDGRKERIAGAELHVAIRPRHCCGFTDLRDGRARRPASEPFEPRALSPAASRQSCCASGICRINRVKDAAARFDDDLASLGRRIMITCAVRDSRGRADCL